MYKWQLKKGGTKEICPACGQKRFVPIVLSSNNSTRAGREYGRCDRENSCGYFLYPPSSFSSSSPSKEEVIGWQPDLKFEESESKSKKEIISFIPNYIMVNSLQLYEYQTLFRYFTTLFDKKDVLRVWKDYKVGTSKSGASIFWQVDNKGRIRTGKIMHYLTNGKRNKSDFGTWVHKIKGKQIGEPDYNLKQCFFGLHLLNDSKYKNKPIRIVEGEKTALFMTLYQPEYFWLASGGVHNVQPYRFSSIRGDRRRDLVLCPDKGCSDL